MCRFTPTGTPTGTVNFFDNGTLIGSGTLSGGVATLTTTALVTGSHPMTATNFPQRLGIFVDVQNMFYSAKQFHQGKIDYGRLLLLQSGVAPTRRIIDVSGDGVNNNGRPVQQARDEAVAMGITINGLAIINDRPGPGGWRNFSPEPLDQHYRDKVIGGPGAFLMVAEDFDSFAFAIRNKLMREISGAEGPEVVVVARADRKSTRLNSSHRT